MIQVNSRRVGHLVMKVQQNILGAAAAVILLQ
jgi:hypothetical protein